MVAVFESFFKLPAFARRGLYKVYHRWLSGYDSAEAMRFMNYGYAELETAPDAIPMSEEDEPYRYSAQLYHHVGAQTDLTGTEVLDVGCGRGGGAAYLAKTFRPQRFVGVDQSKASIDFCNATYSVPGLSYQVGRAEAIPFPDNSFDAVTNVESSRNYTSVELFLREVARVLKPGGHFLMADIREPADLPTLEQQLADSPLQLVAQRDITPEVVHALDLDNEHREQLIREHAPKFLNNLFRDIAGVKGTERYDRFAKRELGYYSFHLTNS